MNQDKDIIIEDTSPFATGGFTQVPNFVLKCDGISHGAKVVYAMLLSYAWQNGFCFPGQEKLARDIGTSRQTANKFIQELAKAELIHIKRRGLGKSNVYILRSKVPGKEAGDVDISPDVKNA